MIRRAVLALALLFFGLHVAVAEPPAERLAALRRGVNITNWFRYPPSRDPVELRRYLSDGAIRALRTAGFTFVRLPVQPELLADASMLAALAGSVARLEHAGLAVLVALHPSSWHLDTDAADRSQMATAWHRLALALRPLDARMTFPELLNEPVFTGDAARWGTLQHQMLASVRAILPASTVVLTGNDWGSIAGLLALAPEADGNVVYSFHLYDPPELTALAAYRPGLDRAALARLPFPATDEIACRAAAADTVDPPTTGLIRFYCAQHWDEGRLAARIAAAADWGRKNHVSVLAGEFGASDKLNPVARLTWLSTVRENCERQGVGWALWGYDDSMGFAVRPLAGQSSLDPAMIQVLGLHEQITVQ